MLLFTYGTLKKGQCRNHVLNGKTFVGAAKTNEKFRMLHNSYGAYPCLIKDDKGYQVAGEVYEIPENDVLWKNLDRIEGVPNLYDRYKTNVILEDGKETEVTVYVYQQEVESKVKNGSFIETKVWPMVEKKKPCSV